MRFVLAQDYESWRREARVLLQAKIHPDIVIWNSDEAQDSLFPQEPLKQETVAAAPTVPPVFLKLAEVVACHANPERFSLLYHMLWQLAYEDKHLLKIASDPLTNALLQMEKSVRRDVHKTKAFVRFRLTQDEDGEEHYIAWHRPDHYSLRLSAPFFARRFLVMRWTILTPHESAHWDGGNLHFGPGASVNDAPTDDTMEALWKDFYRAIFNPARIKIKAMKKEMPVRHWKTLPETAIIHDMLSEAPERVSQMIAHQEGMERSAADFIPATNDLDALRTASKSCEGCELYRGTCQTVFGEGPQDAKIMLVGEQPGNEEDKEGRPFVGPAGQILNRALEAAKLDRSKIYVTNAVKHFKYRLHDGMRYHRNPTLRDITGCKPWLEAELSIIQPETIVCLGVSAARALITPGFTLKEGRGQLIQRENTILLPTYHPSAVLRSGGGGEAVYNALVEDLKKVKN